MDFRIRRSKLKESEWNNTKVVSEEIISSIFLGYLSEIR